MTHDFLKYKELKYKAIETRFDGYRFRSRLEARWAVFFKTLGIPYEYEKEGYHLGGVQYLPDFWLPDHGCWVEIKGQAPTEEEKFKTRMLALYTNKPVFTFSGNIATPDAPSTHDIHVDYPPSLIVHTTNTKNEQGWEESKITVPPEILVVFQLASEAHLTITTYHETLHVRSNIQLIPGHFAYDTSRFLQKMQEQSLRLPMVEPLLKQHWDELYDLVCNVDPHDELYFSSQSSFSGIPWVECDTCHHLSLTSDDYPHVGCAHSPIGSYRSNSPRLIEAYAVARQARFEYGEKGTVEA